MSTSLGLWSIFAPARAHATGENDRLESRYIASYVCNYPAGAPPPPGTVTLQLVPDGVDVDAGVGVLQLSGLNSVYLLGWRIIKSGVKFGMGYRTHQIQIQRRRSRRTKIMLVCFTAGVLVGGLLLLRYIVIRDHESMMDVGVFPLLRGH